MAAGVADRLWEMLDVVDMLEAFEAKLKREPKVTFEIEEWKIGGGYYVRVTLTDGTLSGSKALRRKARQVVGSEMIQRRDCMNDARQLLILQLHTPQKVSAVLRRLFIRQCCFDFGIAEFIRR
jgi:hypothetical protein